MGHILKIKDNANIKDTVMHSQNVLRNDLIRGLSASEDGKKQNNI